MRRCDGVGEGVGSGGAGSLQTGARASETSLLLARPASPRHASLWPVGSVAFNRIFCWLLRQCEPERHAGGGVSTRRRFSILLVGLSGLLADLKPWLACPFEGSLFNNELRLNSAPKPRDPH